LRWSKAQVSLIPLRLLFPKKSADGDRLSDFSGTPFSLAKRKCAVHGVKEKMFVSQL
jgi:hypothetical protein